MDYCQQGEQDASNQEEDSHEHLYSECSDHTETYGQKKGLMRSLSYFATKDVKALNIVLLVLSSLRRRVMT